ncbi:MAG: SDR family NAD(P)-dependent oxidoreductase, partial [Acidobacteriota bacterium]
MNRVAVITGASRGIGAGLAEAFAREGIHLGLCARSECPMPAEGSAETVYREAVDVTDADAVEHFGRRVAVMFGAIDLWINNAGVLEPIR